MPTAWANVGQRLSNHRNQGQRTRRIKGPLRQHSRCRDARSNPGAQADVPSVGEMEGDSESQRMGMSFRAIERELGINRATIKKYLDAAGPPTPVSRAGSTTSSSGTIAIYLSDIVSLGLCDHSFTGPVPGAADRSDIGRNRPQNRASPHSSHTEPERLLGPENPVFRKAGPVLRGGEHAIGTRLRWHRHCQGARGCPHPPVEPELKLALR